MAEAQWRIPSENSRVFVEQIQPGELVGVAGGRARHNSPHSKTKNYATIVDTLVLVLTDWVRCHSAMRPNVPVRSALG